MESKGNVVYSKDFENKRQDFELEQKIEQIEKQIPASYASDIRSFCKFCSETDRAENVQSFLHYLNYAVETERVKKTTWEKRVVAIRKYLTVTYGITFEEEDRKKISSLRKLYNGEDKMDLLHVKGKSPLNKDFLLARIRQLDTRAKAICLVNLTTANRPSEMVRLKVEHFDFDAPMVSVPLKKQGMWHNKRLNLETVQAVQDYIEEYDLIASDYFVGRVNQKGIYESSLISETAYRKRLKKWSGYAPYNFRKTQVLSMHSAGADLATIAKQTGHRSLETLDKHYLEVSDSTVDKYL
ncbi:site-specific integrase [Sporosarcina luteola]|uniref:tyrosine-type recombinase/integrase n=1 Tax=Sporosarcina luteola TaxID=582850 RepID=UPI00203D7C20|nr:tyrosine-type recombinase/integrase [Sporosarcina luteola]MCM3638231.1 site-specific integrase [Sporosarcina luteola]